MTKTKNKPESRIRGVVGLRGVAEHFEVTTRCIQNWIVRGESPKPYRIGRRILRWDAEALDAWIEAGCPRIGEGENQ